MCVYRLFDFVVTCENSYYSPGRWSIFHHYWIASLEQLTSPLTVCLILNLSS